MVKPKSTSTSKSRPAAKKPAPAKGKAATKRAATKVGKKIAVPAKKAAPAKKARTGKAKSAPAKGRAPVVKKRATPATAKASRPAKATSAKATSAKATSAKSTSAKAAATKASATKASATKASATKASAKATKAAAKSVAKALGSAKGKAAATTETPTPASETSKKLAALRKLPPRKPGSVICPLSGWEVMPTKAALSERTLNRLQARLVEEREQQLRQADDLAAEAEELAQERDPGDTQFDEESGEGDTVNVERERDLLLSATARGIVEAIDRALARLEAGTYGVCVPAGRKLSLERLEAIPYAEECVDCKARAERRR